jgi:diguanylate cyclase (GGDEF)-like protein
MTPAPALDSADPAAAALAAIWVEHEQAVRDRVGVLECAVAALTRGTLDEPLRAKAQREAHKLAGVLGTFGFPRGSELAREVELILEVPEALGPQRVPVLSELVTGIRGELTPLPRDEPSTQPTRRWVEAPHILIVDDDEVVADQLVAEAERRGMRPEIARSPAEARELAERTRPDAVLLDLNFGDDEGVGSYELLSELASSNPPVPVLVFTVRDAFTDRMEVARRGARGFLQKTLPPEETIDQVAQLLERTRPAGTPMLAVDDDPAIRDAVRALLEPEGLAVTTLDDPMRFWEELERVSPALLLLDVDMPGASGIELCRVLRNDPRWAAVPVIFLTSRRDAATVQEVFAAGADDYLVKPIIGAELVARIRTRLERFRLHQALAENDSLTGVSNRRRSRESLGQLLRMAERFDQPLCLAELDLDHFKQVNDRYGHAAGDAVLRRLGELLTLAFRGEDVVARWGGEEFVVGLYGMAAEDARQRMAQLLESFREEEFTAEGQAFRLSFSAGVAQFPGDGSDIDALYRSADEALYRAKSAGRDRVFVAGELEPASRHLEVLVVEDDDAIGDLLCSALDTRGYRSQRFDDGARALAALTGDDAELSADLVLLDVDLPGLDGLAVLAGLQEAGALAQTKVIVLTARTAEAEVLKALELGAFDHVAKPFSVAVLMQKVRRALER